MPLNYQQSNDGTLRDPSGNTVGKVDMHGQVRDGWQDKGRIDKDGKYYDEYGHDQGWSVQDSGSSGGGGGLIAILVVLVVALSAALFGKVLSTETGRKAATIVGIAALVIAIAFGVGALIYNAVDAQARESETAQALANPNAVITIRRVADVPCSGDNCDIKKGRYTVKSNLRTVNVRVDGWCCWDILGPGQSITCECDEEQYGRKVQGCFSVSVIKRSLEDIDIGRPICY